jgi:hypothetical protein
MLVPHEIDPATLAAHEPLPPPRPEFILTHSKQIPLPRPRPRVEASR